MMRNKVCKSTSILSAVLCLVVLVLCSFEALGQSRPQEAREPLASVPAHQRARLVERLKLVVEYQGMRQWDRLYDLLTESIKGGRSREAFANRRREIEIKPPISIILTFVPTEAITIDESQDGGAWFILGCAQYRRNGSVIRIKSSVTAELQNNEWLFSEIGAATQIDGPEESCAMPERSSQQTKQTAARSSSRCSTASNKESSASRQR